MLLWLFSWLEAFDPGFAVFQYLTLRTILSVLTALGLSLLVGPVMIRRLSALQIGQAVRQDGPQSHLSKAGTPTMGGALIIVAMLGHRALGDLLIGTWCQPPRGTGLRCRAWVGDYRKVVERNARGLPARWKYFWQTVAGSAAALALYLGASTPVETTLIVPFFKDVAFQLGPFYLVLAYFVLVGTSNAVNLTDGLDGLAIMPTVMVAGALGLMASHGECGLFTYLQIPLAAAVKMAVLCGVIGAGLGFLWFNTYPAQVFMGDVGALALGAALGLVALVIRQELVLFIMGGVFVLETVSVVLQVLSFRYLGRRIFRMAPLHHHFELKGWPEPRVIVRFWIITLMLVLVGLSTLKLR